MRTYKVRAILSLGLLLSLAWVGTFALFSDTATSDASFATGTVDITASPATALFTVSGMKPGNVNYAPLTVSNAGTLAFTWTMTTTATNADGKGLASALVGEVKVGVTSCDAAGWASGTTIAGSSSLATLATSAGRALATATSEVTCFRVELPSTAGNGLQGAATTATFYFTAT